MNPDKFPSYTITYNVPFGKNEGFENVRITLAPGQELTDSNIESALVDNSFAEANDLIARIKSSL